MRRDGQACARQAGLGPFDLELEKTDVGITARRSRFLEQRQQP